MVALLIVFIGALSGKDPPLNPLMMLWVNLIMDTMGALALGTEAPTMELLDRRPYKRNAPLISRPMVRNITMQSIFQVIYACTSYGGVASKRDGRQHRHMYVYRYIRIIFLFFTGCVLNGRIHLRSVVPRDRVSLAVLLSVRLLLCCWRHSPSCLESRPPLYLPRPLPPPTHHHHHPVSALQLILLLWLLYDIHTLFPGILTDNACEEWEVNGDAGTIVQDVACTMYETFVNGDEVSFAGDVVDACTSDEEVR